MNLESLINMGQEHLDVVDTYLLSRKLSRFGNIGYIPYCDFNDTIISNSIIIPIYTPTGKPIFIDSKNLETNEYLKIHEPGLKYTPLYNFNKVTPYKIVTEGIFNAESIRQTLKEDNVISTLRASVNAKAYHILASSVTETLYLAFDNDRAGTSAKENLIEFMSEYYPSLSVKLIDFPYNDLNEFLCKKGKSFFINTISNQIKGKLC